MNTTSHFNIPYFHMNEEFSDCSLRLNIEKNNKRMCDEVWVQLLLLFTVTIITNIIIIIDRVVVVVVIVIVFVLEFQFIVWC